MTEKADSILVLRCQLGDRAAWERLVHLWHPRLWRFIFGMLGDRPVAEDVLQNVWLKIVRTLVRLREPERLESWMYQIARNVMADRFRERYRRPVAEELTDLVGSDIAVNPMELNDSLRSAMSQLHPIDRESVVLYYLEEKSLDEVAGISGVPSGTVKSRLHRARSLLREILENENE